MTSQSDTQKPATAERRAHRLSRWRSRLVWLGAVVVLLPVAGYFARPFAVDLCLDRSQGCLQERRHERALDWLQTARFLGDDSAELHFLLARTFRRTERFDRVEDHLRKAHERGYDVGSLEREQWLALAQTGQFAQVREHWDELFISAGSDGPEICNAYVAWCLSQFRLNDAMRILDAWEKDFPTDPQPHFKRGQLWETLQKWADAVQEYRAGLELAPERTDIRLNLAQALVHQSRIDEARKHFERCLKEKPDSSQAAVGLGRCLNKQGETERARRILSEQLHHNPDRVAVLNAMGELELTAGRPEKAIPHLKRAVEKQPEDHGLHYALGRALRRAGKPEAADQHFEFVNEASKPLMRLAKITPKVVRNPQDVDLRYEVAMITWRYKSREDGARWLRSLLRIAPDHRPAHEALARHYELLGRDKQAAHHRKQAERLASRSDD